MSGRLNKKKKIELDWIRDMEDQIEKCKLWEVEADRRENTQLGKKNG